MEPVLDLRNITKQFSGLVANDHIDFSVKSGEIHALLGENGAGKSTLMKIVYGLYHCDDGEVHVNGQRCTIHSPRDAIARGIGMVHQHFMLVPSLTVLENVMLGLFSGLRPLRHQEVRKRLIQLCNTYRFSINLDAKVMDLSVGKQQIVELLKALYRDAHILIMDEPTAVLTPLEVEELFSSLMEFTRSGRSVIFISHKLWEVMRISQRVTVLRLGRVVGTLDTADTTQESLAELMVGRRIVTRYDKPRLDYSGSSIRLENITTKSKAHGLGLKGISLEVKRGEILGVAGVDGNGQQELGDVLRGMAGIAEGSISFEGRDIAVLSTRQRMQAGMASIPEDRQKHGLVLDFSVAENLVLDEYYRQPFTRRGVFFPGQVRQHGSGKMSMFDIRPKDPTMTARKLSGGNQQKVILARELGSQPRFVLAMQPTRGLDVGASEFVHSQLIKARNSGAGILFISADLDEILLVADRVIVLYEGRINGEFIPGQIDFRHIGMMMGGSNPEQSGER
jgi:simple sugar transport system ATP-binding protein